MGWDAVWWMGDAWYDALGCSVMNGWCIVWCSVWWMGDAWVMHEWCDVNEWMNERMNEWMVNKWVCGLCRMTVCILLYFNCICNMSLYLFRAILLTNKHHIHPRTSVCRSRTNPTCNIGAQWGLMFVWCRCHGDVPGRFSLDHVAAGGIGHLLRRVGHHYVLTIYELLICITDIIPNGFKIIMY